MLEQASPRQKEKVWEIVDEVFEEIEQKFPTYYKKYHGKLERALSEEGGMGGMALTEEEAKRHVSRLHNQDGTRGEHWDKRSAKNVIDSYPKLSEHPFWDAYYALNTVYSKFYDPAFNTKHYAKMASQLLGSYSGGERMHYGEEGIGFTGNSYNRSPMYDYEDRGGYDRRGYSEYNRSYNTREPFSRMMGTHSLDNRRY